MKGRCGGGSLINVKDCVDIETNSLWAYSQDNEEKLLIPVKKEEILMEGRKTETVLCKGQEKYEINDVHGRYLRRY